MIKLISQFDNEKMRSSVATPTCGPCCSCCCCCVVTTLASSIITARNFSKAVENMQQGEKEGTSNDRLVEIENTNLRLRKKMAFLAGFFLFPIAFLAGIIFLFGEKPLMSIFLFLGIFGGGLYFFKDKYKLSTKKVVLIFILTLVAFVVEIVAWPALLGIL